MNVRSLTKLLLAIAVTLAAPMLCAQDGLRGALPRADRESLRDFNTGFGQSLAIADFDNDQKLDGAVLVNSGRVSDQNSFRIEFHLSGSHDKELSFETSETTLAITALDVNHDGAMDLIVEQPLTHRRLYVWLNDGRGGFHRVRVEEFPSSDPCKGDQLVQPSSETDRPSVCLPQASGKELKILAASSVWGRPPSADILEGRKLTPYFISVSHSPISSRAPPLE